MCIKITAVLWVSLRVGAVLSTLADTQLCWASCWLIMKDIYNNFFMSKKKLYCLYHYYQLCLLWKGD